MVVDFIQYREVLTREVCPNAAVNSAAQSNRSYL